MDDRTWTPPTWQLDLGVVLLVAAVILSLLAVIYSDRPAAPEVLPSQCPGTIEAEDRYQESLDVAMREGRP